MSKKLLGILSSFAVVTATVSSSLLSASAFSGNITFEIPEHLIGVEARYYTHIWNDKTGSCYEWQTKPEKMVVSEDGKTASYEIPEGDWNLIIVSSEALEDTPDYDGATIPRSLQSSETVFNENCIGDTCYAELIPNYSASYSPVTSLYWRNNPDCGPHKVVGIYGTVSGNSLLPSETNQSLYDDFVNAHSPELLSADDTDNWNNYGLPETQMTWEEVTNSLAQQLGLNEEPTEPTEPTTAEPTEPATAEPTEPATAEPTQPSTTAPTQPTTVAPTQPSTTAPQNTNSSNTTNTTSGKVVNTSQQTTVGIICSLVAILTAGFSITLLKKKSNS